VKVTPASEIKSGIGITRQEDWLFGESTVITVLIIEMTLPDTPKSRNQKYVKAI
jgi:hypothetical protein